MEHTIGVVRWCEKFRASRLHRCGGNPVDSGSAKPRKSPKTQLEQMRTGRQHSLSPTVISAACASTLLTQFYRHAPQNYQLTSVTGELDNLVTFPFWVRLVFSRPHVWLPTANVARNYIFYGFQCTKLWELKLRPRRFQGKPSTPQQHGRQRHERTKFWHIWKPPTERLVGETMCRDGNEETDSNTKELYPGNNQRWDLWGNQLRRISIWRTQSTHLLTTLLWEPERAVWHCQ